MTIGTDDSEWQYDADAKEARSWGGPIEDSCEEHNKGLARASSAPRSRSPRRLRAGRRHPPTNPWLT